MEKELLEFIKNKDGNITEVVENSVSEFSEIIEAENNSDTEHVPEWLKEKRGGYSTKMEEVGIKYLDGWLINPDTGNISNEIGRFFLLLE